MKGTPTHSPETHHLNATPAPTTPVHTAIVGAGPYGLSLAAHLAHAGVPFRCFGEPMQSWATRMPAGMMLKSDGFASNLSAPAPFTLEDFCNLNGRPYHATQIPVALEDFVAYGREFARRLVPTLEPVHVTAIEPAAEAHTFRVTLTTGESFFARNVVIATGIIPYHYMPEVLRHLPASVLSHTIDHASLAHFAQHEVTVLGRGSSALDAAALLQEAGADVTLITRSTKVHLPTATLAAPTRRSTYQRFRHPLSPLGHSTRSWLSSNFPDVYFALPGPIRRAIVYKHLGPAGAAYLRGRIFGRVNVMRGWTVVAARLTADGAAVDLTLSNARGVTREHHTGHILAGTGFRIDLHRLSFLAAALVDRIRRDKNGAPRLSRHFETSVPGLYIIGSPAAASFGPLLRFVAGVHFAVTRITQRLQRTNS